MSTNKLRISKLHGLNKIMVKSHFRTGFIALKTNYNEAQYKGN